MEYYNELTTILTIGLNECTTTPLNCFVSGI